MPPLGPYHSQPCPVTRATSRPFQPPPSSLSRTPLAIILPWYLRCKMATWPYALLTVSCILILKKIQGGREKEQSVQFIFNDRRPQRHPRWLRDESRFPFFSSLLPPPPPSSFSFFSFLFSKRCSYSRVRVVADSLWQRDLKRIKNGQAK